MNFTHYNNILSPLNKNNLNMATSSNMLAQEIYDQFLACKICFETYRHPKTLSCLHSFCQQCLQSHSDSEMERHNSRYMLYHRYITCPICRKKTDIPTGGITRLPENFLVTNLTDIISRTKRITQVPNCGICISNTQCMEAKAVSKCLDCNKFLCQNCREMHLTTKVTQNHNFIDVEGEKAIECKVHSEEVVRFYCEPCEVCICILCTFQDHKDHEVSSFTEGMNKYKNSLDSLVTACHKKTEIIKKRLGVVQKCDTLIKNAEETIRDTAIASIGAIRKKEKQLICQLHESFGEASFSYIKNKEFMQEALDNFSSTCNIIDMVMKERGIELLLLKKELQEKLNSLLDYQIEEPPLEIDKSVEFVAAQVNFGYLKVDNFTNTVNNDNDSNQNRIIEIDEITQTYDESMDDSSSTDTDSDDEEIEMMDNSIQTDDIIIIDKKPMLVDNSVMTDIIPLIEQNSFDAKTQDSKEEKVFSDFGTNTCIIDQCERSTLTIKPTLYTKNCDTKDLFTLNDSSTETPTVRFADKYTMSYVSTNNKTIQTPVPVFSNRYTMTPRTLTRDCESITDTIDNSSKSVMTSYTGLDKAINTRTIVTISCACGEDVPNDPVSFNRMDSNLTNDSYEPFMTPPSSCENSSPALSEHNPDDVTFDTSFQTMQDLANYNQLANKMVNEIFIDAVDELSVNAYNKSVINIADIINYINYKNKTCHDVSVQAKDESKEIEQQDKCVGSPKYYGKHVETNTEMKQTSEIDCNTESVLMLSKSVLTDSIKTVHKGTSMIDVGSAYLNKVNNSKPKLDMRRPSLNGFPSSSNAPQSAKPVLVDRASSPVMIIKLDKSISVSQSDLIAPIDQFKRAGMIKSNNEDEPLFIPRLPLIREDSKESPSDDEFNIPLKFSNAGSSGSHLQIPTSQNASKDKSIIFDDNISSETVLQQNCASNSEETDCHEGNPKQTKKNSFAGFFSRNHFVSNQIKKSEDSGSSNVKNKARMQKLDITHLLNKSSSPSTSPQIRRKAAFNDGMTGIHEQSEINISNSNEKSKNLKKLSLHLNAGEGIKSKISLGDIKERLRKTQFGLLTPSAFAQRSPLLVRKVSQNDDSSSKTKSPPFGNTLFIDEENIDLSD